MIVWWLQTCFPFPSHLFAGSLLQALGLPDLGRGIESQHVLQVIFKGSVCGGQVLAQAHKDGICMLPKRPQTTGREKTQRG